MPGSPSRSPRRSGPRFAIATSDPRAWPGPRRLSAASSESFLFSSRGEQHAQSRNAVSVTCPRVTNSHSARSVRTVRCPVPRAMSARKDAPKVSRYAATSRAAADSPWSPRQPRASGSRKCGRSSRITKASGADRVGVVLRVFPLAAGEPAAPRPTVWPRPGRPPVRRLSRRNRPQVTTPARHRCSSSAGVIGGHPRRQNVLFPSRGPATPCPEAGG